MRSFPTEVEGNFFELQLEEATIRGLRTRGCWDLLVVVCRQVSVDGISLVQSLMKVRVCEESNAGGCT